jgi:hypothetical protein
MKRSYIRTLEIYRKLEADNNHNECAILVTFHFGTDEEFDMLQAIKANHKQRGHILQEEIDIRRNISQKYFVKLVEAAEKEKQKLTKKQNKS